MVESKIVEHKKIIERYYRIHAHLYDATRWSFLFGRSALMRTLPELPSQPRILEVGCGTGKNIEHLTSLYPEAHITGIDISQDMLQKASKRFSHSSRVKFINQPYSTFNFEPKCFDLIIFSYSLTMMRENAATILRNTMLDLNDNGYVAVVDFHWSSLGWFRNWMKANHVAMNETLLSALKNHYHVYNANIHKAYLGWWEYFLFIGRPN